MRSKAGASICKFSTIIGSAALALAGGILVPTAVSAQPLFVGGNPGFSETQVVIGGAAAIVVEMTGYLHEIDLPPHSVQPIGLEEFFFVIKGKNRWLSDHCEKWIEKVQKDERAWTTTQATYPYLAIQIAANSKPVQINGVNGWHDKDVQCWEAMDFGPPLY